MVNVTLGRETLEDVEHDAGCCERSVGIRLVGLAQPYGFLIKALVVGGGLDIGPGYADGRPP